MRVGCGIVWIVARAGIRRRISTRIVIVLAQSLGWVGLVVLQHRRWSFIEARGQQASSANGAEGSRTGAELREARQRIGCSVEAIAAELRIKPAYLQALEDGQLGAIPGNAYAIGFLRSYARALGLDADAVCRRFREEAKGIGTKTVLSFPAPVPDRGVPAGALVLLGTVLAIGAYVGWYRISGDSARVAEPVPAVPARLEPLAAGANPPPAAPSPQIASIQPGPATPPAHQPAEAEYVLPSVPPSQAAAMAMPRPAIPGADAAGAPGGATTAASGLPSGAVPDGRVVLRAHADTWLQVRDRAGNVLLNRVLHAGDSGPVPARPDLLITTGNAGGIDVLVDGTQIPSFGGPGVVKHDVPLDPDALKSGKATPVSAPVAAPSTANASTNRPAGQ